VGRALNHVDDCKQLPERASFEAGLAHRLCCVSRPGRAPLGALFLLIAAGFAGIAVYAAQAGGSAWIIALAAGVLAGWMGDLAFRAFR
jgi:hypothetical protein